jgi:hypothetical protein
MAVASEGGAPSRASLTRLRQFITIGIAGVSEGVRGAQSG